MSDRLDIRSFTVGPVQENAYIVRLPGAGTDPGGASPAVLIDPGDEPDRLLTAIEQLGVQIEAILITHCHFDHIGAVAPLARATGASVYCPEIERPMLENIALGTPPGFGPFESYTPEHTVGGGERLRLADLDIEVIFTPGHSPGHVTYAIDGATASSPGAVAVWEGERVAPSMEPVLFSGDVLFQGSIGRTDLPFADHPTLERSLATLIDTFPPATTVYPGHMGITTLQRELATNPFLVEIRAERQSPTPAAVREAEPARGGLPGGS